MKVEQLTELSPTLTGTQIKWLTSFAEYLEAQREVYRDKNDKSVVDMCTNGLSFIILIATDE